MPLASSAIGITSTIPVAGSSGGVLWLSNVVGSTYLLPYYSGLTFTTPWRFNFSITVFSGGPTPITVTGTSQFADVSGGNGSVLLDFSRFREARITTWSSLQILSGNVGMKIVDVTNSVDITQGVTVNSTTPMRYTSPWSPLGNSTSGDISFQCQVVETVANPDVIKIYSVQLGLR